ncbi:MAG: site-specific DNA-methyltransferase [Dehalogenimonas sp.]|uniref:Site-specific DNA-methyltransferase n=1 Tax=Candidatus Dehalogenimonas loeffleri TaxID=3127115 RepID=A0ABZ2J8Y7_9CHLR|nr:site-specific DNA-methyltransferase [Dehalogenimonas sp.]
MTEQPEHFDLNSQHLSEDKQQELLRLFPEVRTEGGKIDFERLKLALGETVDVGKERYGMTWPGKAECFKTIQQPSMATLRPAPEESVNFDTTENLIIEGDNLEVLKLLQKSYLGKVKMIYIDPPYNTGNDFIYPDNYTESLQTYLEYTGQVDSEGRKFGNNTDADGRFHSKWMNMMYPRLYLARNLLTTSGIAFISIDDNEIDNLRKLCNEVFGESNFLAQIIWQKIHSTKNDAKYFSDTHEYILCYAKNINDVEIQLLPRTEKMDNRFLNPDDDSRGPWASGDLVANEIRKDGNYDVMGPTGKTFNVPSGKHWVYSQENMKTLIKENRIWFGKNGDAFPRLKRYLSEVQQGRKSDTLWLANEVGHNQESTREVKSILGYGYFETPKPVRLINRCALLALKPTDICIDFFAGSGTTAHAILELNQTDFGNRKFILVQLPEKCPDDSEARKAGYEDISKITEERVRRVIKKLNDQDTGKLDLDGGIKQDRGFRVFKLADSNFKTWDAHGAQDTVSLEKQLELHIDHIKDSRNEDDLLYELLLKSGFPLTTPVKKLTVAGKDIYSVAEGLMFICLEKEISLELIKAMADKKPERVVCLDAGFAGNDQLKANAVQIFKTKEIKKFETV